MWRFPPAGEDTSRALSDRRENIRNVEQERNEGVFWVLRRCVRSHFLLFRWLLPNANILQVPRGCTDARGVQHSYKAHAFISRASNSTYARHVENERAKRSGRRLILFCLCVNVIRESSLLVSSIARRETENDKKILACDQWKDL